MTIGPEPMSKIFLISERFGMLKRGSSVVRRPQLLVCRLAQLLFRRAQEHGKLGAEMVHELSILPLDGLCARADLQRLGNDLLKRDHVLEWNRLRRDLAFRPVG